MASLAVNSGFASTITFQSGFFAQILSMSWDGISRPAINTTHMGSTAATATNFGVATYIPGKVTDPGALTVEFHFNPDTNPPIDAVAETITIGFPGSATPATWAGSGFMTDFSLIDPLDDKMTARATLKFSGLITTTAGA